MSGLINCTTQVNLPFSSSSPQFVFLACQRRTSTPSLLSVPELLLSPPSRSPVTIGEARHGFLPPSAELLLRPEQILIRSDHLERIPIDSPHSYSHPGPQLNLSQAGRTPTFLLSFLLNSIFPEHCRHLIHPRAECHPHQSSAPAQAASAPERYPTRASITEAPSIEEL